MLSIAQLDRIRYS